MSALLHELAFVNGEWRAAADGACFEVRSPADGTLLAEAPDMQGADALVAIDAAEQAQPGWAARTGAERAIVLRRWHELIIAHTDELAMLITAEQGKPLAESMGEVNYGASFVSWFAAEAERDRTEQLPSPDPARDMQAIRQPVGVVAAITPWNFPLAMVTRKCAPALAAGCTVVLKPAESTPLSALALAALADEAGLPAGVFNVLPCSAGERVGDALVASEKVRKLSFTGSTAVGKKLLTACAATVKNVSLELGGNAPFIVFDDADLDTAVAGAIASKYRNTGQTCICANRLLVQDGIYTEFATRLADAVTRLKVGAGTDSDVQQGPLINEAAVEKVAAHVADAVAKGATVVCGGERVQAGATWFQPTVLTDVTEDMRVAQEESFGPIAPLFRFGSEADALAIANNTRSGLAAYVYTADDERAQRVAEALEYGMVGVNEANISSEVAPFGGIKESGIGREGSHYGIDEYLELKYICRAAD